MSQNTLTPDLAVARLSDVSADIRAGVILDGNGSQAAQTGFDADAGDDVRDLIGELFAAAAEAAGADPAPDQFEVALPGGAVYAVRDDAWTVAVVASRFTLSSLVFYDLRMVLSDLAAAGAGAAS